MGHSLAGCGETISMQETFEMLSLRDMKQTAPKDARKTIPQDPFYSFYLFLGEWSSLPFTARDILTRPTLSAPRRALAQASTFSSCAFCEQEGHLAAPSFLLADFFSILLEGLYSSGRVERKMAPSCRRRSSQNMSSTRTAYLRVQFG